MTSLGAADARVARRAQGCAGSPCRSASSPALAVLTAAWCSVSLGWSWADALDAFVLTNAVMGLAFGGCGALLAWHRPGNAIGWLFLVGGLLQSVAAAASPLYEVLEEAGASTAVLRLTVTVFVYSWPWAIGLCIPLALLLFPDGRPVSPAWRWVVGVVALTGPLFVLEMGAAPEPVSEGDQIGYLTISGYDRLDALWTVAELGALAAYVLAFASLVIRYRRGSETTRRQLLWLVLAMIVVLPVFCGLGPGDGDAGGGAVLRPAHPGRDHGGRGPARSARHPAGRVAGAGVAAAVAARRRRVRRAGRGPGPGRLRLRQPVRARDGGPGPAGRAAAAAPAAAGRPGHVRRPLRPDPRRLRAGRAARDGGRRTARRRGLDPTEPADAVGRP